MRFLRTAPRTVRTALAIAGCALAGSAVLTKVAIAGAASDDDSGPADARQQAYAAAAERYGVPERVLLGVSYLSSRWDVHQGMSTSGGYGPMHLTDLRGVTTPAPAGPRPGDDPRGDLTRPRPAAARSAPAAVGAQGAPATQELPASGITAEGARSLRTAATLTGTPEATLKADPVANIDGGAAVLAKYQRDLGRPVGATTDPAGWYAAVARYSGASDLPTAQAYADEVFGVISEGVSATTNDGHALRLAPGAVAPDPATLAGLGLSGPGATRTTVEGGDGGAPAHVECPRRLACEWIPAPYQLSGNGSDLTDYYNYDKGQRPRQLKIDYIVIHDSEGSYDDTLGVLNDPYAYTSWHYTVRSGDGHVAQHVRTADVPWHAGNWYLNTKSVGIEHEGVATDGSWYTETLYRSSARLVRYLAQRFDVPLDRQHIIGHDNVPALKPTKIPNMHWDPGPYWDWDHYMALLGAPLHGDGHASGALVMIRPDFARNTIAFHGCPEKTTDPCVDRGLSTVVLRSAPSDDAPLIPDPGLHRDSGDPAAPSSMNIADLGARAATGQRYAVAGTSGDWVAIWYNGMKAWLRNPASARTLVRVSGRVVTPKAGRTAVAVYGGAFAEDSAYPSGVVPGDFMYPLTDYTFAAGQRYSYAGTLQSETYRAKTFDGSQPGDWTVIRGTTRYVQIQFGNRFGYVDADDVDIVDP